MQDRSEADAHFTPEENKQAPQSAGEAIRAEGVNENYADELFRLYERDFEHSITRNGTKNYGNCKQICGGTLTIGPDLCKLEDCPDTEITILSLYINVLLFQIILWIGRFYSAKFPLSPSTSLIMANVGLKRGGKG